MVQPSVLTIEREPRGDGQEVTDGLNSTSRPSTVGFVRMGFAMTWLKTAKRRKYGRQRKWSCTTAEAKAKYDVVSFAKWYSRYYLASRYWRDFRAKTIRERGGCCELCTAKDDLFLHHVSYLRLFEELPEDVQILCKFCHSSQPSKRIR